MENTPEKLITTKELCDYLNLSRTTIERYREEGMPYKIIGPRNVRFEKSKVLEWLEKRGK